MKFRALLAAVFLLSFAPLHFLHAGQDRVLYPPSGGPGQGGVIRNMIGAGPAYWVSIEGGGFYKSTDSGATWSVSNAGLNCTFVSNLFVISQGTNIGRVYAGTACGGNSGVYMSTNEGASWTLVSLPTIPSSAEVYSIGGLADGSVLRASSNSGVYYSFDFGITWAQRNGTVPNTLSGPNGAYVLGTAVFGPNTLAIVDGNGVFWSTDAGTNWHPSSGLPAGAAASCCAVVGSGPYAGLYAFVDGAGAYKSTDNGLNWSADFVFANAGLPAKRARFFFGLGPAYWAATFSGIYRTNDINSAAWLKISNGLPQGLIVNANTNTVAPQTVFAAADTVYKSTDGGLTWNVSDTGLGGVTFVSSLASKGLGGVQVDPSNPTIVYAATVNKGMFKSIDGGASWSAINTGLPANLSGKGGNFRIAASNTSVLYVQTGGLLYKTIDGGANWTNVWTDPVVAGKFARAPEIDPTNPNIVYVASSGGLYKTTDGGTSWQFKHPGGFNTPFGVTRPHVLASSPQNVLLAAYNSDSRDVALSTSGLYLSTNGGDTWKQLASNEKMTHARFIETPGSSRVSLYANSLGYFDQPASKGGLFKCVDILGDFNPEQNCVQVDLGSDPGQVRFLAVRRDRVLAIATSSGLAKHQFMFLGPDFNNDSRADILWRNPTNGGTTIWQMDGAHLIGERENAGVAPLRTVASPWSIVGLGDFDGDGTSDILWRNSSTGENYIYFMDGGVILPSEGYIRTVADPTWGVAGVGDFNGDGKADILWRNGSTGDNYIYLMNGTAIAGEGYTRTVPVVWQVKALGDFNQDNKMDIVWRNSSTGENYVYPMDGVAILPSETYLPTVADTTWNIVGAGDYDGPNASESVSNGLYKARGVSGILWRNATTGAAYMWRMSSPLHVADSPCGNMGCPQGSFLPQVSDTNWQVINK